MKKSDYIKDKKGQWAHPGKKTAVPTESGKITMKGVPYPVYGIDETGYAMMMYPGMEYEFPGTMVYETPMMQSGGQSPLLLPDDEYGRMRQQAYADSLTLYQGPKNVADRHNYIDNLIDQGKYAKAKELLMDSNYTLVPLNLAREAFKRLTELNGKEPELIKGSDIGWGFPLNHKMSPVYKKPVQPIQLETISPIQMKDTENSSLDYSIKKGYADLSKAPVDIVEMKDGRIKGRFNLKNNFWKLFDREGNTVRSSDGKGLTRFTRHEFQMGGSNPAEGYYNYIKGNKPMKKGGSNEAFPQAASMSEFFDYGAGTPELPYIFAYGGESYPQANPFIYKGHSKGTIPMILQDGGQNPQEMGVENRTGKFLKKLGERTVQAIEKEFKKGYMQGGGENPLTPFEEIQNVMDAVEAGAIGEGTYTNEQRMAQNAAANAVQGTDNLVSIPPNPQMNMHWDPVQPQQPGAPIIPFPQDYSWNSGPMLDYRAAGFADPTYINDEMMPDPSTFVLGPEPGPDIKKNKNRFKLSGMERFAFTQMGKNAVTNMINNHREQDRTNLRYNNFEDIYQAPYGTKGTSFALTGENMPYKNNISVYDDFTRMAKFGGQIKQDDEVYWDDATIEAFLKAGGQIEYLD